MIVVAKKLSVLQLVISRMPKMCAILQLVSAPLNPIPIAEHFRRSHPHFVGLLRNGDSFWFTLETLPPSCFPTSFSEDFVEKKSGGRDGLVFVVLFRHTQSPSVASDSQYFVGLLKNGVSFWFFDMTWVLCGSNRTLFRLEVEN